MSILIGLLLIILGVFKAAGYIQLFGWLADWRYAPWFVVGIGLVAVMCGIDGIKTRLKNAEENNTFVVLNFDDDDEDDVDGGDRKN